MKATNVMRERRDRERVKKGEGDERKRNRQQKKKSCDDILWLVQWYLRRNERTFEEHLRKKPVFEFIFFSGNILNFHFLLHFPTFSPPPVFLVSASFTSSRFFLILGILSAAALNNESYKPQLLRNALRRTKATIVLFANKFWDIKTPVPVELSNYYIWLLNNKKKTQ